MEWKVGDEVSCEFMGVIKEIAIIGNGEVRYKIDNGDHQYSTTAYCVKPSYLFPLPKPEVR